MSSMLCDLLEPVRIAETITNIARDRAHLVCKLQYELYSGEVVVRLRLKNLGRRPLTAERLDITYEDDGWSWNAVWLEDYYLRERESKTLDITSLLFSESGFPAFSFVVWDDLGKLHSVQEPEKCISFWRLLRSGFRFKGSSRPQVTHCGSLLEIAERRLRESH